MVEAYAAIEMARGETPHGTVHRFMQASVGRQLLFHRLEVLDVFTVGSRRFVRFRTDQSRLIEATEEIRQTRAVVLPNGVGYKICLPDGREAPSPTVKMHMVAMSYQKRLYRGPASDLWEAQFADS